MQLKKINFPVLVWSIGVLIVSSLWFEKLAYDEPELLAWGMPAYLLGTVAVIMLGQHFLTLLRAKLQGKDGN